MAQIPPRLKRHANIRVIAPALSLTSMSWSDIQQATKTLEKLGFSVSLGTHVNEANTFNSATIESRVHDFEEAFSDAGVDGILTVNGGFNSHELLERINWKIIKNNPKPLCGYSDITALNNALLAQADIISYSGPHFSTFAMKYHIEETINYFIKCLCHDKPYNILPSKYWSDDKWWEDQENRTLIPNQGWQVVNPGYAEGTIIGGNLSTLMLLRGTRFMPMPSECLLFIEEAGAVQFETFYRNLSSFSLMESSSQIKAILIGRFQKASPIDRDLLKALPRLNPFFRHMPIIAGVDIGHTYPLVTFPIGGKARIVASESNPSIEILEH